MSTEWDDLLSDDELADKQKPDISSSPYSEVSVVPGQQRETILGYTGAGKVNRSAHEPLRRLPTLPTDEESIKALYISIVDLLQLANRLRYTNSALWNIMSSQYYIISNIQNLDNARWQLVEMMKNAGYDVP